MNSNLFLCPYVNRFFLIGILTCSSFLILAQAPIISLTVDGVPVREGFRVQIGEGDVFDEEVIFSYIAPTNGNKPDLFRATATSLSSPNTSFGECVLRCSNPNTVICSNGDLESASVILNQTSGCPNTNPIGSPPLPGEVKAKGNIILKNLTAGSYEVKVFANVFRAPPLDDTTVCVAFPLEVLGRLMIKSPADIVVEAAPGAVVHWDDPTVRNTCNTNCTMSAVSGFSELGMFGGSKYYLSNNVLTWEQGRDQAQQRGGQLAKIETVAENEFITAHVSAFQKVLIGLNDVAVEGSCAWADETAVMFNNMFAGDGFNTDSRDYGFLQGWDGKWVMEDGSIYANALLEIPCDNYDLALAPGMPESGSWFAAGTMTPITYLLTNDCGEQVSGSFNVSVIDPGTPAEDYCEPTAGSPWHQWISRVEFGSIHRASGKKPYSFYQDETFVMRNQEYPIELTAKYSGQTWDAYWRVWIDWDQNGVFDSDEVAVEEIAPAPSASGGGSKKVVTEANISIPGDALPGTTRMRVTMKRDGYAEACEDIPFGEIEDYLVTVLTNGSNLSIPLQMELNVDSRQHQAALQWYSSLARFASEFVVERSVDGTPFQEIHNLVGGADGFGKNSFEWTDQQPLPGRNTYRVRQVYSDGQYDHTPSGSVTFADMASLNLFPLPAEDHCFISLDRYLGKEVQLQVFDMYGQPVLVKAYPELSQRFVRIDLTGFPPGTYSVMLITADGLRGSGKVVKVER